MDTNLAHSNVTVATADIVEPAISKTTIKFVYFIALGIIIFIGYICNTLTIAVFIKSKALRHSTTGLYLVSLAVADFLFMVGMMLRWLARDNHIPGYTFYIFSDASCQFVHALRYSSKLVSSWITVVITAQRFVIIAFPLRAESLCTRQKAYIGILLTYIVCFICGSIFPIFTLGLVTYKGKPFCGYKDREMYNIMNWIFLRFGSMFIPGSIILVFTVLICVLLAKARAKRHQQLNGRHSVRSGSTRTRSLDMQLTVMLLAVAFAFIALRLPYTILYYIDMFNDGDTSPLYYLFLKMSDLLATLNYAVNFFLYCISGSTFRQQFLIMFHCDKAIRKASTWSFFGHSTGSTNIAAINNEALIKRETNGDGRETHDLKEYQLGEGKEAIIIKE